jgi:phosphoenolpyruvate carboxylase
MVLAKANSFIASQYFKRLSPPDLQDFADSLIKKFMETTQCVIQITSHKELQENNFVLLRSINMRKFLIDPLNLCQIELLRRLRADETNIQLQDAFIITINGISAGMRATG